MANINVTTNTNDISVQVTDNQINITPTATQIRVFSGGYAQPGGANTEIQYNDAGVLAGAANITYTNGNMVISNNNFKITGGINGYFLQTDGSGNLTWYPGTAFPTGNGTVGGANMQLQFNNAGNFGGIAGLTANAVTNNVNMPNNLAVVSNVSANYFIGNGSQLTGVITVADKIQNGNSNVSVAANSNITFGVAGNANVVTVTGNGIELGNGLGGTISGANLISANIISATGNVTANYFIGNGSQLTGIDASQISNGNSNVRVFANSDVTISIGGVANVLVMDAANSIIQTVYSINVGGGVTATQFIGGGGNLSNITGANVTGTVANANYAAYAGNATVANTANSVAGANVSGIVANANYAAYAGNATVANTANSVAGANVSGQVSNALVAGTVYTNAQPNITSIGNLTDLVVLSNSIVLGNSATASPSWFGTQTKVVAIGYNATIANTGSAGSNVDGIAIGNASGTSGNSAIAIGSISFGSVNSVAIGTRARANGNSVVIGTYESSQITGSNNTVQIGYMAGDNTASRTIAIGQLAGHDTGDDCITLGYISGDRAKANSIAIGWSAGTRLFTDPYSFGETISIGKNSGANANAQAIAIGSTAGGNAENASISIGATSGKSIGQRSIAIGLSSGNTTGNSTIAIGDQAGGTGQGDQAIAIGRFAGRSNVQPNNSIVLNATGANLNANIANSLFVKPVRNTSANYILYYNDNSGEISYDIISNNIPTAQTVSNAAQPNITSVGTLSSLSVSGNVTANFFSGNGSLLTGLPTSSIIANGDSNVNIGTANGDVVMNVPNANDPTLLNVLRIGTNGALGWDVANNSTSPTQNINVTAYKNGATGAFIGFQRARGNRTTPLSVQPGDGVAGMLAVPHNGSGFNTFAGVFATVAAEYVANNTIVDSNWRIRAVGNVANVSTNRDSFFYANGQFTPAGNIVTIANSDHNLGNSVTANVVQSNVFIKTGVYADTTTRDSAIPTPQAGMIVLVSNVGGSAKFQGYDGATWANLN